MEPTPEPRASRLRSMSDGQRRALIAAGIVVVAVVGGALHVVGILPPG